MLPEHSEEIAQDVVFRFSSIKEAAQQLAIHFAGTDVSLNTYVQAIKDSTEKESVSLGTIKNALSEAFDRSLWGFDFPNGPRRVDEHTRISFAKELKQWNLVGPSGHNVRDERAAMRNGSLDPRPGRTRMSRSMSSRGCE